ncbi:MAG: flagellar M-ring protein FliF [Rhodobacteraceae bacterium]|nr:flagellar M-ring protein FliF [Paracoccaceae bacterium]
MQQMTAVWQNLDTRRQIIVAIVTAAVFGAILLLANIATRPGMALLYAGLDGNRSGEVLAALDQLGANYDVRGTAIYVDSSRRDELRMSLAAEGLPENSGTGYELLDSLSGFGTTSQMFDAAYLRAKEGELARTITALPSIKSARVHIADSRAQGFRSANTPTASVAVSSTTGGITVQQAKALKYLVASAVAGLSPDNVSVIDGEGGLVEAGDPATGAVPDDRAEALRRNVERILEARVGYGNAIVEVSVDTITERESITERRFDPEGRVAISTDTEERTNTSKDSGSSAVTVASNLPSGDASGSGKSSQSNNSETRERTNFEVSETTREVLRNPGAVRRLTVAVLVDGISATGANGEVETTARSDEELASLKELVAAAVGFNAERGDVITIKSMAFEPVAVPADAPGGSLIETLGINVMTVIQLSVLAIVVLVLGLFVLRPILSSQRERQPLPALPRRLDSPASQGSALTGEIDDGDDVPNALPVSGQRPQLGAAEPPADPVARLRHLISDRKDETVEILRGWMEDSEEETT